MHFTGREVEEGRDLWRRKTWIWVIGYHSGKLEETEYVYRIYETSRLRRPVN